MYSGCDDDIVVFELHHGGHVDVEELVRVDLHVLVECHDGAFDGAIDDEAAPTGAVFDVQALQRWEKGFYYGYIR